MSVKENMEALARLLDTIAADMDNYLLAVGMGDHTRARTLRQHSAMTLDTCFDLLDRSVEQCHGLAARRRAEGKAPAPPVIDRGLS